MILLLGLSAHVAWDFLSAMSQDMGTISTKKSLNDP